MRQVKPKAHKARPKEISDKSTHRSAPQPAPLGGKYVPGYTGEGPTRANGAAIFKQPRLNFQVRNDDSD